MKLTKRDNQNKGYLYIRTEYVDYFEPKHINREKVFAEKWIQENKKRRGINWGYGILQDLFIVADTKWFLSNPGRIVAKINPRDRFIVATVIQWLGSNVGFCFLRECLDKCGYKIVKKDND
jgi:hypothetical protein